MSENLLIGIAGGSASGKSTVARELAQKLGADKAVILELDAYYKDLSHLSMAEREMVNFDHSDALDTELLKTHINALKAGKAVEKPLYDYVTHTRKKESEPVAPVKFIIVEGLFALVYEDLCGMYNHRIYIDTPDDIRLARRVQRDTQKRGRSAEQVIEQYLETVRPMHQSMIAPSRKNADVVIAWEEYDLSVVDEIAADINKVSLVQDDK